MISAVVNALGCHRCDPGSNPGVGMWQGSCRPSKVGGFPRVLWFPPLRMTTELFIRFYTDKALGSSDIIIFYVFMYILSILSYDFHV